MQKQKIQEKMSYLFKSRLFYSDIRNKGTK